MCKFKQILAILAAASVSFTFIECETIKLAPCKFYDLIFGERRLHPFFVDLNLVPGDSDGSSNTLYLPETSTDQSTDTLNQQESVHTSDCSDNLIVIDKSEWDGRAPKHESTPLEMPVKKIIIQSTYTNKCSTQV